MRLGIIARSDNTGLGNQTRELVNMLSPDKILLIDSTSFNRNEQHPEWYNQYDCIKTDGFPSVQQIKIFLNDVDVVLSCETFYDQNLIAFANKRGVKTILQYNYELFGNLSNPEWKLPTVLISPSVWNIDIVNERFGSKTKLIHLPPPTDTFLFNKARQNNLSRTHKRILHVAGKKASKDRNGTDSVIEMLSYSKADYELVITSQTPLVFNFKDERITVKNDNINNKEDLYDGFDAMVLPRRYAGLCLPMNEALISGLPVFMTNISPNNHILPEKWLVDSNIGGKFKTKLMVNVYNANPEKLAELIDNYINSDNVYQSKQEATDIGFNNFSVDALKDKWLKVINE